MRRLVNVPLVSMVGAFVGLALARPVQAADCPKDSVRAGTVCIDKYEASVWQIKPQGSATSLTNQQQTVIDSIRAGNATLADLRKIGATQLGLNPTDPPEIVAAGCPVTGAGCTNIYAVSIPGVTPSAYITWVQAAAAARNSFKRLPSNAEWTAAALGTPDNVTDNFLTTCNVSSPSPGAAVNTGSRSQCVSDVGAFDMVGNLIEWVADWVPQQTETVNCGTSPWSGDLSGHGYACLNGNTATGDPGAMWRGGGLDEGAGAGVFAVSGENSPNTFGFDLGFRGVR